jgi:hypothetical protein
MQKVVDDPGAVDPQFNTPVPVCAPVPVSRTREVTKDKPKTASDRSPLIRMDESMVRRLNARRVPDTVDALLGRADGDQPVALALGRKPLQVVREEQR